VRTRVGPIATNGPVGPVDARCSVFKDRREPTEGFPAPARPASWAASEYIGEAAAFLVDPEATKPPPSELEDGAVELRRIEVEAIAVDDPIVDPDAALAEQPPGLAA
jgi:hypothetical protein